MVYDGVRIFRMLVHHGEIMVDVEDLLFWLFTAWMVFRTLFYYNRGALRGYAFLGMFLGVLLYTLTVSRGLLFVAHKMVPIFRKGWDFAAKPWRYLKEKLRKSLKKAAKNAQTDGDLQKKTPKQVHLCQKCGILTMYF